MVSCEDCNGACCRWAAFVCNRSRFNAEFYEARGMVWRDGAYWVPLKCPKLNDEGKCSIYPNRPMLCRLARVGDPKCLTARKLEGID